MSKKTKAKQAIKILDKQIADDLGLLIEGNSWFQPNIPVLLAKMQLTTLLSKGLKR